MSKRKERRQSNRPNIPAETLRRAREEAGLDEIEEAAEAEAEVEAPAEQPRRAARSSTEARPRASTPRRKQRPGKLVYEEMTREEVAHLLHNPTRIVPESELQAQYSYVIADLRSMILLAAFLFVSLIIIAVLFVF